MTGRKLKSIFRLIAKKIPFLRKIMRKLMYLYRRTIYFLQTLSVRMDEKTIVFETFSGKSYSDNPRAIYEYMIGSEEFKGYSYIWIFKEPDRYRNLERNDDTRLVRYGSRECNRALAVSKYWIFNYRALDHWIPGKDQVYVQCWHGTPLKRLGYDIEKSDNAMNSQTEIRDKYKKDSARFKYLLSPCRFATERFISAWNLHEAGREDAIIELGYPRNDFLVNHSKEDVQRIRERQGLGGEDRRIVLYAPTWRDNQHNSEIGYTYENKVDFDYLRRELGKEYIILFRAHYLVTNSFDFDEYAGFVYDVSDVDDINELYVISDMLVTDYSSVFFDYAILEKPMIFYMYDLKEYRDEVRGFYLGLDELPGRIVTDEKELVIEVKNMWDKRNLGNEMMEEDEAREEASGLSGEYEAFNRRFNYLNDGSASERLVRGVIASGL